jgi:U3 small nucleolar RNA-associated protein 22
MNKVAVHLAKHSKKLGTVEYKWSGGSNRSPYLQLVPNPPSSSKSKEPKFQVGLHFGMQSIDWIPQLRLVPNRCNVKGQSTEPAEDDDGHANDSISVQSQLYNQSLLFDARHQFEDQYLAVLADYPNTVSALVLIQVWALQRGLWRNHDGWSKENAAIFLIYLLRTNRMNPRMTPIQQFTVVLQMWSNTNWLGLSKQESHPDGKQNEPILRASQSQGTQFLEQGSQRHYRDVLVLPVEGTTEKQTIRMSNLARLYETQTKESPLKEDDPPTLVEAYASTKHYTLGPVLLDPTLVYNYLGHVSPNYMRLLQFHAERSLQGLKETRASFGYLFMKNCRFWSQWDLFVKIPTKTTPETNGNDWETSTRSLVSKLELALGNRINGMRVLSTGNGDAILDKFDLDQVPRQTVDKTSSYKRPLHWSPTGTTTTVLGFAVNSETSQRVVDRGPPSDHLNEVRSFVKLWGNKAQLRRFKDGAIVQAVVWNDDDDGDDHYQNDVRLQGGYIAKIARHIIRLHYTTNAIDFSLPNLSSVMATKDAARTLLVDPLFAHQNIMKAFESLSTYLRNHSQPAQQTRMGNASLGLPLAIDAVEPLSPCLRYSELFPPLPHPFLGGKTSMGKRVAGAIVSDPVLIQIRFGASSKWPSDLKAIGAAKTAMLIQLAKGIDTLNDQNFDGPVLITPTYLDLGYQGYCFRILVRADPEIRMLRSLVRPSARASSMLQDLTRAHIVAAKHHSMVHAVHTLHPSSAAVVRMAKRWVANHLLSGLISVEAIDLLVVKVYSDRETPVEVPSTVSAGFLRFLHLLSSHDWVG